MIWYSTSIIQCCQDIHLKCILCILKWNHGFKLSFSSYKRTRIEKGKKLNTPPHLPPPPQKKRSEDLGTRKNTIVEFNTWHHKANDTRI